MTVYGMQMCIFYQRGHTYKQTELKVLMMYQNTNREQWETGREKLKPTESKYHLILTKRPGDGCQREYPPCFVGKNTQQAYA